MLVINDDSIYYFTQTLVDIVDKQDVQSLTMITTFTDIYSMLVIKQFLSSTVLTENTGHFSKYLDLCSTEARMSYGFEMS